ncbi:hypothetical protein BGW80DRAFT_878698 [Lactifluus volemus]|nr:hypothetical protein BGW80DRAFT_878698 [Lactifluus volemus]
MAYAICTPSEGLYTVDDNNTTTDCMLIENGIILATGSLEQVHEFWSAYKPDVSLKVFQTPPSSIIVPGLADAHGHILQWGYKVQLPLEDCTSIDDQAVPSRSSKCTRRPYSLDRGNGLGSK